MINVSKVLAKMGSNPPRSQDQHTRAAQALFDAINADVALVEKATTQLAVQELQSGFGIPAGDPAAILESFQSEQIWDNGWQAVFKAITINAPHTSWEIASIGTGIVFKELEAGGKVRMARAEGSTITATVAYYAAGLEVLDQWVENQQYWKIEAAAVDFINAWQKLKAEVHYAAMDAVSSSQNLAWNTTGANELAKDVKTINAACTKIINDQAALGNAVGQNQPFVLVTPTALRDRISDALGQIGSAGENRATYGQLRYTIVPVATTFLADATKYYVCLPGRKSQSGTRKELTAEKGRNIVNLTDVEVRHGAFGVGIGDEDQFQRCATA